MKFVDCSYADHAAALREILNHTILTTTDLYDYHARSMDDMAAWFAAKDEAGYPVIGAVDDQGRLLGAATYGRFRLWAAYKYTVENSVYVHPDHRRKGVARALMEQLIDRARQQQYHVLVGAIDTGNTGSIKLHQRLGFTHAGTIRHAAFKFGRWLDLALYQLILETPEQPVEG